eukprot:1193783-Prorocentrum_minimum.AAC.1
MTTKRNLSFLAAHNGLRGFLSTMIMLFHIFLYSDVGGNGFALQGGLMPMFFVLSGFTLAIIYGHLPITDEACGAGTMTMDDDDQDPQPITINISAEASAPAEAPLPSPASQHQKQHEDDVANKGDRDLRRRRLKNKTTAAGRGAP